MNVAAPRKITESMGRMDYGWWVAFAAGLTMAVSVGPLMQGASAIFSAVEDDFGWSRTQSTTAASLGQMMLAFLSPVAGMAIGRVGRGPSVLLGLSMTGAGAIGLSFVDGLIGYYAAFMVMFTGFAFGGFMPCMSAVNAWLPKRKAAGMAFVMAGGSVGAMLVPVLAWAITEFGWRPAMVGIGVLIIVIAPIVAKVLGRPALPLTGEGSHGARRRESASDGFTTREALKTWAFYALAFGHMLSNLAVAAVMAHIILHLQGVGMALSTAALVLPVVGVTEFLGRLGGGFWGDSVNRRVALFFLMSAQAVALLILAYSSNFWMAVLFAVFWGVGFGTRGPVFHALRADYFGNRSYATILGISSFLLSLGMMASPVVVGWIYDQQLDYTGAFLGLAATSFLAAVLTVSAGRPRRKGDPHVAREARSSG